MESKNDMRSAPIAELLDVSDLTYLADGDANVVSERSQRKMFAQKPSYVQRQTCVITLNTGNDFISMRDSSLRFTLGLKDSNDADATTATFGGGSCLNLFENIRIIARSGEVLTEINKLNLYNYFVQKITHEYEWRAEQQGAEMLKFGKTLVSGAEYIVPLRDLCEFFRDDVLLPANVARGLRIELTLASTVLAFTDANATPADRVSTYTVDGLELLLDSYRLSGSAQNTLNKMASSSGLVLTYCDVNNSPSSKADGQSTISTEVRQSVSMANSVFACVRLSDDDDNVTKDSFKTRAVGSTDSYQYRIGSVYLPQERIQGKVQWYSQMSYAWDKTKSGHQLGIRSSEFDDNSLAVADIDRYWTSGSGMAINNSTTLNLNATVASADICSVDIFLKHTRSCTAFLENVVIRD